ncbi:MAG TPA: alpha/beta hydrolase, partial [Chryseobacterium indologenes]|nr:alpha/beta hydrolase [Chryseobacterium indologenes]
MKFTFLSGVFIWLLLTALPQMAFSQSKGLTIQDVKFESQGITLAG